MVITAGSISPMAGVTNRKRKENKCVEEEKPVEKIRLEGDPWALGRSDGGHMSREGGDLREGVIKHWKMCRISHEEGMPTNNKYRLQE